MPTIIDSLITMITLDPRGYKAGAKQVEDTNKDLKSSISSLEEQIAAVRTKSTKATAEQDKVQIKSLQEVLRQKRKSLTENKTAEQEQIKRQKEQTQGIGAIKNAALGLAAVLTAGAGIKAFVTDIIAGDAATGRMAANLGESAQTATAFGVVIKSLGGDAKEGIAAIQNLAAIRFAMQAKGDYSQAPVLSRLGVSPEDLNDIDSALGKIAATAKTMPKAQFYQFAKEAGFSDGAINALELGNIELAKQIQLAKEREHLTDEQIAKDQQFTQSLNNTLDAMKGLARDGWGLLLIAANEFTTHLPQAIGLLAGVAAGLVAVNAAAVGAGIAMVVAWAIAAAPAVLVVAAIAAIGFAIGELIAHMHEIGAAAADMWYSLTHQGQKRLRPPPGSTTSAPPTPPPATSSAAPTPKPVGSTSLQRQRSAFAVDYLKSQGISDHAARGAIAGSIAESQLDPGARNPTSGAFGIGQWLGPRKAALFAQYGPNPSFDQQLQFLAKELKGADAGGASVTGATTALAAMQAYITKFMRPAAGRETSGDLSRGASALAGLGGSIDPGLNAGAPSVFADQGVNNSRSSSVRTDVAINKIEVNVAPGSDGRRIGTDVAAAVREHSFVAMANTGLA